jgi:hypothetical protein
MIALGVSVTGFKSALIVTDFAGLAHRCRLCCQQYLLRGAETPPAARALFCCGGALRRCAFSL